MISTYPPSRDGISTYCKKLCETLVSVHNELRILVISNKDNTASCDQIEIKRAWSSRSIFYPFMVFGAARRWGPDVIHLQHEYWLYGQSVFNTLFILLLFLLRLLDKPVIITMHHVISRDKLTYDFFRRHRLGRGFRTLKASYLLIYTKLIGILVSRVIVHFEIALKTLVKEYDLKIEKIVVIPHGIDYQENPTLNERKLSKKRLNLQGKVLLIFGEIRRGKGLDIAIQAMSKILVANPLSTLIIAGYPRSYPGEDYLEEIMSLTKSLGLEKNVIIKGEFIPEDKLSDYFVAADIIILPYTENEIYKASGPLSLALSYSKPIIATRIKMFTENGLKDKINVLLVRPADSDSLACAVNVLLENKALRKIISKNTQFIVKDKTWKHVASQTLQLYHPLN